MDRFEIKVKEIEKDLKALVEKEKYSLRHIHWFLRNYIFRELGKKPALRNQILKLVYVFPDLDNSSIFCKHLIEYLKQADCHPWLSDAVNSLSQNSIGRKFLYALTSWGIKNFAHHFIIDPSDLNKVLSKLQKYGAEYSLDILGEEVLSEDEAKFYKQRYFWLIDKLIYSNCKIDISLKISSLYSQFSPLAEAKTKEVVVQRLREILSYAKLHDGKVTIDMEQYEFRGITLSIFQEVLANHFPDWQELGIAYQTYLKDSYEVFLKFTQWLKKNMLSCNIRLVKGAYWDYEIELASRYGWPIPVYTQRSQTDENFNKCVDIALSCYPHVKTAVATHNLSSIAYAIAKHQSLKLPAEALEIQVLYGLGMPLIKPIGKLGYKVKVYVGIGDLLEGIKFLARRILENSSQASSAFFK